MERAFAELDPGVAQEQVRIRLDPPLIERMHAERAHVRRRDARLKFLRTIYGHPTIGKPFRALYSWFVPKR
jgi:hypothetical protein